MRVPGRPPYHLLLIETANGRAFVEGSLEHVTARLRGLEVNRHLGVLGVVGAAVYDPDGGRVGGWGSEPALVGPHRFTPVQHVTTWGECRGCERPLSPGMLSDDGGRCSTCVYAEDPEPRPSTYAERPYEPPPEKRRRTTGRTNA